MQKLPFGAQGTEQMPPLQNELQHSWGALQPPPLGVHIPQLIPQNVSTSFTQTSSQVTSQQKRSALQIWAMHGEQNGCRASPSTHASCEHGCPPQVLLLQTALQ